MMKMKLGELEKARQEGVKDGRRYNRATQAITKGFESIVYYQGLRIKTRIKMPGPQFRWDVSEEEIKGRIDFQEQELVRLYSEVREIEAKYHHLKPFHFLDGKFEQDYDRRAGQEQTQGAGK